MKMTIILLYIMLSIVNADFPIKFLSSLTDLKFCPKIGLDKEKNPKKTLKPGNIVKILNLIIKFNLFDLKDYL